MLKGCSFSVTNAQLLWGPGALGDEALWADKPLRQTGQPLRVAGQGSLEAGLVIRILLVPNVPRLEHFVCLGRYGAVQGGGESAGEVSNALELLLDLTPLRPPCSRTHARTHSSAVT